MMQAEATDSSLREGIESLDVKDTEKTAADEEDNTNQQDAEMTDVTEEGASAKDEKSNETWRETSYLCRHNFTNAHIA